MPVTARDSRPSPLDPASVEGALRTLDLPEILAAYLFGSHAAGRPHRESDVDVVVLNDAPPHFARRIVLDGRELFCGDPESAHAFRRDVQLRAADLEPFLRRTRRLKLEALAS